MASFTKGSGASTVSQLTVDADLDMGAYDLKTDDILESTAAAGVTVDGGQIKDGAPIAHTAASHTNGTGQIWISAGANWELTNCTQGSIGHTSTIDFIDSVTESARIGLWMPSNYAGGNLTVKLVYYINDTANVVRWIVRMYGSAEGESYDPNNGAEGDLDEILIEDTLGATANDQEIASGTNDNPPSADEFVQIRVDRTGGHANDTASNDAQLAGILIEYPRTY